MKLFLKRRMGRGIVLKGSFVKTGPVPEGKLQSL
jgi:hypothetical protein